MSPDHLDQAPGPLESLDCSHGRTCHRAAARDTPPPVCTEQDTVMATVYSTLVPCITLLHYTLFTSQVSDQHIQYKPNDNVLLLLPINIYCIPQEKKQTE